jgi:uncharacterized membrane protein
MDGSELIHLLFRWVHVLAGVMWIGQIWSLMLVHQLPQGQAVSPGLSAAALRAHKWMRGATSFSWLTGIALLGIVYYGGGALTGAQQSSRLAMGVGIVALFGGWVVYDAVWMRLGRHPAAAAIVSLSLFAALAAGLPRVMTGRAAFIHLGAMLATIILANVQRHIWPIERRRLTASDPQPPTDLVDLAALRLRHNAAFAVAVIFFMISNHFPLVYGNLLGWILAPGVVGIGGLLTRFLGASSYT